MKNRSYILIPIAIVVVGAIGYVAWYSYDRHEKIVQVQECNDTLNNPPKPTMVTGPDGNPAPLYSLNGCVTVVVPPSLWNLVRGRIVFTNVPQRMKINPYSFTDILLGRYTFGPTNIVCDQSATTTDCSSIQQQIPAEPILAALIDGHTYTAVGTYHASDLSINGLKSYTSDEFGISFSYPKDYLLFENEGDFDQYTFHGFVMAPSDPMRQSIARAEAGIGGEGPESVVITFFNNPQSFTLEQWLKSENNAYTNYHSDDPSNALATTTVAGVPAFKYHSDLGLYASDYIAFQKERWIAVVSSPSDLKTEFSTVLTSIKLNL